MKVEEHRWTKASRYRVIFGTTIIFLLIVSLFWYLQYRWEREEPTKDPSSPTGYYIPKDIDDAFIELDKILSPKSKYEIMKAAPIDMIKYHHGLGMWLRNNWGLWHDSRLAKYFNNIGIYHPDDMSSIVLTSYWRKMHSKPLNVDGQVKLFQKYWEIMKGSPKKKEMQQT